MRATDVLIVGAGQAGGQSAIFLRRQGFTGSIAMVGEEPHPPYERPPLSKDYLSKEKDFERLLIRADEFWPEQRVDLVTGVRAVSVDAQAHTVQLSDGQAIRYGALVWATGGRPRRLACAGATLTGVHVVRTRADADAIDADLARVQDIVVVGGGYIGLEAAAVMRKFGKAVTVVESLDRVLSRVAAEPLSRFFEVEHAAHGVDIRLNATVEALVGQEGRVRGVRLADGEVLPAQMVIFGIGIIPSTEPLIDAGAVGRDGVDVDEFCRASLPDVYAVGDCAAHLNAFAGGRRMRVESVQNANDQAMTAAKAIVGRPEPYAAIPWFWSDQYDLKLQTVGLSAGYDALVLRGDPLARSFSLIYLREGRVIALDCVNAPRDYVQGRRLVTEGLSFPAETLADQQVSLKEMA